MISPGKINEKPRPTRCYSGPTGAYTCGIILKNMGGRLLGYGRLIGIIRYPEIHGVTGPKQIHLDSYIM